MDDQTKNQHDSSAQDAVPSPDDFVGSDANTSTSHETGNEKNLENIEPHKAVAVVGYLFPVIFFIPLLSDEAKKNSYAMFHANQQLILLLTAVLLSFANSLPFPGKLIGFFGGIALFIMSIINLLAAARGQKKELPYIGGYKIL